MLKPFATRSQTEMKDVLMDPGVSGPEVHYYMIRGGKIKKNITVWEVGKIGDEYIKTYGHYHVGDLDETYWVVAGEGVVLLQKNAFCMPPAPGSWLHGASDSERHPAHRV